MQFANDIHTPSIACMPFRYSVPITSTIALKSQTTALIPSRFPYRICINRAASRIRHPTCSRYFAKHYRWRTARCAVLINNYTGTASLAWTEWYLQPAIRRNYSSLSIQYLLDGRRRVNRQSFGCMQACIRCCRHDSETTFSVNKVCPLNQPCAFEP